MLAREGALDSMMVEGELAPELERAGPVARTDQIRQHIESLIGVACNVVEKAQGEVPRVQGKAVLVHDLRNRNSWPVWR